MTITVYITSFNQRDYLKQAIESVLLQTRQADEIIIVDDCSSDGSQEMIREYAERNSMIKFHFQDRNLGVAQTRITALNMVSSEWVTYLDGDDLYLPNKLAVESELASMRDADLVFSNNAYVPEEDPETIRWKWLEEELEVDNSTDWFLKTLTRDFPGNSLFRMELVRFDTLKRVGFHDPQLKIYEDYDLRVRLAKVARIAHTSEVTTKIRISRSGLSKSPIEEHIQALRYIFTKYTPDINRLPESTKVEVSKKLEAVINDLMVKKKKTSVRTSLVQRVARRFGIR